MNATPSPAPTGATLVDCTHDRHAAAILDIFNDAILTSTALYDYQPRALASMEAWFQAKRQGGFPVVGFEDAAGVLMGFASYGTFRAWPAYKYSVEHSVYVDRRYRGRGLGEALLRALIERARLQQVHVLVGGI
ncbi:acetyltransferase (GNAT) domain protein, partial [Bordetella bronchiseptica D993]